MRQATINGRARSSGTSFCHRRFAVTGGNDHDRSRGIVGPRGALRSPCGSLSRSGHRGKVRANWLTTIGSWLANRRSANRPGAIDRRAATTIAPSRGRPLASAALLRRDVAFLDDVAPQRRFFGEEDSAASAGEPAIASNVRCESFSRMSACLRPPTTSRLIFSSNAGGSPGGATMANHVTERNPGSPDSSMVGTSGTTCERSACRPRGFHLAGAIHRHRRRAACRRTCRYVRRSRH